MTHPDPSSQPASSLPPAPPPESPYACIAGTAEYERLRRDHERQENWKRWGPYLSERQWATVREDYSANGDAWDYFPHDQARSRAYRWGEDGLLGITDRECRLCFGLALWNGRDPILKERLFGLTGPQGNHGEDVKELYYYLDSTPTHSYMRALYKYPHAAFPYDRLVEENAHRGRRDGEFELLDTGIFEGDRYWDIEAEYAKGGPNDLLIKLTLSNRGPEGATLHVLPTLWFRNTWSWGGAYDACDAKPGMARGGEASVMTDHCSLGRFNFHAEPHPDFAPPQLVFTENETNAPRLFGQPPRNGQFYKDAFHDYVIHGNREAVNPEEFGTKAAAYYVLHLPPRSQATIRLRLVADREATGPAVDDSFAGVFAERQREADAFYESRLDPALGPEERRVARQAYAGILWSKQFYYYVVSDWLDGDRAQPAPPPERKEGRNRDWKHLFNRDVISMPDKWEYPWYAAWDLAFHMLPLAEIDPDFAKGQLVLMLREWYMHPNGQLPAYEYNFCDVNPPVHAWACWRVYKMTAERGQRDTTFLARVFQKLLINFTWWVNRKDQEGRHLFSGGFLGLDNIGVFDRSRPLPHGGTLEQADATAWMAFYCGTMLSMALELARHHAEYEDVASKFFEHFVAIVDAMNTLGGTGLWDDGDGYYYDRLHCDSQEHLLRVRSLVGLVPLIAVEVLEDSVIDHLPGFKKRMQWFLDNRPDMAQHVSYMEQDSPHGDSRTRRLLAVPSRERLRKVLHYLLDEDELLSPYGIRSLSKAHAKQPVEMYLLGEQFRVDYDPGESTTGLFGGNSNWRGPVWLPMNYLIVEALERYHHFYGDAYQIEYPTGSGRLCTLKEVASQIGQRVAKLFLPDQNGRRAAHGDEPRYQHNPHFKDLILFYEYFHGDTGQGLGASHQTGWTALATRFLKYR